MKDISQSDRIIVVMGPTGVGKSTFIECATRQDGRTVGHGLRSCTKDVRAIRSTHPADGYPVVFVDTPGFDDTSRSDVEILSMIANYLMKAYKGNINLASIIYLHKINDNRITGSLLTHLQIFSSLCGQNAMPNVVIATTMWSKVRKEEGDQREEELKCDFWKDILAGGCTVERFLSTYESAWCIIGSIVRKSSGKPFRIQEEMREGIPVNKTGAGGCASKAVPKASMSLMQKLRSFFTRSL